MFKNIINTIQFALICTTLMGQSSIQMMNALPATEIVKAPVFNVVKKYFAKVDTVQNTLFIYDYRSNPKNKASHFHQLIYEIPFDELSQTSIYIDQIIDDGTKIYLKLNTIGNEATITQYWINENELVCIQVQDELSLGPWESTPDLQTKMKNLIDSINDDFITSKEKVNKYIPSKTIFKYGTDKVTMIGIKDLDGKLYSNYFLAQMTDKPPLYNGTKNFSRTIQKLKREVNKNRNLQHVDRNEKLFYVVNISDNGNIDSVFCITNTNSTKLEPVTLEKFIPAHKGDEKVKSKIVLIQ